MYKTMNLSIIYDLVEFTNIILSTFMEDLILFYVP